VKMIPMALSFMITFAVLIGLFAIGLSVPGTMALLDARTGAVNHRG